MDTTRIGRDRLKIDRVVVPLRASLQLFRSKISQLAIFRRLSAVICAPPWSMSRRGAVEGTLGRTVNPAFRLKTVHRLRFTAAGTRGSPVWFMRLGTRGFLKSEFWLGEATLKTRGQEDRGGDAHRSSLGKLSGQMPDNSSPIFFVWQTWDNLICIREIEYFLIGKRGKFYLSIWAELFLWSLISCNRNRKGGFVEVIGDSSYKIRYEWKVQVDAGKCPAQWLIPKVVSLDQTFLTDDPEQRSDGLISCIWFIWFINEQIIKISKERKLINRFYSSSCSKKERKKNPITVRFHWFHRFKTNKTLFCFIFVASIFSCQGSFV